MTPDEFRKNMETGIFWITQSIAQGAYPKEDKAAELKRQGVTHLFNVGTMPRAPETQQFGFQKIFDLPVVDLQRLPDAYVLNFLDVFHASLMQPDCKIYIHCIAGQNRSPTLLWLYLVACGISAEDARELIEERTLDAVGGHARLYDDDLLRLVKAHGKAFLPLKRGDVLVPA